MLKRGRTLDSVFYKSCPSFTHRLPFHLYARSFTSHSSHYGTPDPLFARHRTIIHTAIRHHNLLWPAFAHCLYSLLAHADAVIHINPKSLQRARRQKSKKHQKRPIPMVKKSKWPLSLLLLLLLLRSLLIEI